MDPTKIRQVMLEVIQESAKREANYWQESGVLQATAQRCGVRRDDDPGQRRILTCWHDLFRTGVLAWGQNLLNPTRPWYHVTDRGQRSLDNLSRDPANPDGYLAYLNQHELTDPVARSYITEALSTYNNECFKATAVLVGAAAERLVLSLRDTLVDRLNAKGTQVPSKLLAWQIKTIREVLKTEFDAYKKDMGTALAETYAAYWDSFSEQIRRGRNDAGHPTSVDPVTPESVHASLLIFPELAKLVADLEKWVKTFYV